MSQIPHKLHSTQDALPSIIQWAASQDQVRVVLLTSTRAIPGAVLDPLSDYDVVLIVRDIHPWVDNRSWLNDFGEVLIAYWDPIHPDPLFGIDVCANVVQYRTGFKIDFTLWPITLFQKILSSPALPAELDAGYRVLLDKDVLTASMLPPTGRAYVPKPPDEATYRLLINDFLSDAPYVAKCLWRGELLPAKWCLDYDMKYIYLLRMLEWYAGIKSGWSVPVGYLGKGLTKLLPGEIWSALEGTYSGAEIAGNWDALHSTMQLFRRVSIEVGDHFGYAYPLQLHEGVSEYINRIRHMPHPDPE